jgi:hypothetical protein
MRAIFISYRRDDSEGQTGRLFDDLVAQFGQDSVFMDVVGIAPGRDFRRAIDEQVATCGILLAMIGKNWLEARDESGHRRLDDPMDFVRLETASALKRDIPVIPVLVRGAAMPRAEQLPLDLVELAYRNAVELSHARWDSDVQVLINALRPYVKSTHDDLHSARSGPGVLTAGSVGGSLAPEPVPSAPNKIKLGLIIGAIALVGIVIAAVGYLWLTRAGNGPIVKEQSNASPQISPEPTPKNSGSILGGGTASTPSPVASASDQTAQTQQSPEPSPSVETGLPKTYTLAGTWEDDDGKVFATVADASESGAFEMEQIKPAKEHDTLWKATLKDRDVEIDVFAMPSGSHQMHLTLRLSLDGNRMAGLLHPGGASPDFPPSPIHFRRLK